MSKVKKKEVINSSKLMMAAAIVIIALLLGWFIGTKVVHSGENNDSKPAVTEDGVVNDLPSRNN